MTQFLLFVSTFLDFWFLPFVIGLGVSIIIEQILRASGNQYDPVAVKKVEIAMRVRKYFWRQAWLFNLIWFSAYLILMIVNRPERQMMPDMIWQG